MNNLFIPYEQALALKELGFDEPCFGYYIETGEWIPASFSREGTVYPSNSDLLPEWVASPLYQQAFRWLEANQSLYIERVVSANANEIMDFSYRIISWRFRPIEIVFEDPYDCFDKYKADIACLKKLIEITRP